MMDKAILPKDDADAVAAVRDHCTRMQWHNASRWTRHLLAQLYMQGYRVFTAYDSQNVKITTAHLNTQGEFPLQLSNLVVTINKIIGLLSSTDLRPDAKRQGYSLAAIREKAMAQVVADTIFDKDSLNRISPSFDLYFSLLGSVGLCGHLENSPRVDLTCDVEVVHPREVIPFPDPGNDYTKVRGMVRERFIPLEQLRDLYGNRMINGSKQDLELFVKTVGTSNELYPHDYLAGVNVNQMYSASASNPSSPNLDTSITVAKYRELFITGERNCLLEYMAFCGRKVLFRKKYEREQQYSPLTWARFMETGSFYGAGMFDILFSLIREFEKFVEDLIRNTKSNDRYPTVILPHGTISEKVTMRETGHGMRFVFANAEPRYDGTPPIRPVVVAPHNAGDTPGRTAAYLQQIIDQSTPIRDLIKEKGRIDSLPALQFLSEEDSKSVSQPVNAKSQAFGDIYRYGVQQAITRIIQTQQDIPISRMDLDLLGAVIDFDRSRVRFTENLVPDISKLSFEIKKSPQSEVLFKGEAVQFAKLRSELTGAGDFDNLLLTFLKAGVDVPVWMEDIKSAYRTVVQNILTVYNDGQFPGFVFLTPHTERPDIQLRVLNAVMSSPEMRLASPKVVDAFITYRETLMSWMGGVLPPQVPDPLSLPMNQMGMGQLAGGPGMMAPPML